MDISSIRTSVSLWGAAVLRDSEERVCTLLIFHKENNRQHILAFLISEMIIESNDIIWYW